MLHPEALIDALDLKPGMSVADFGCGGGHFAILASQKVGESGKVYAIDVQSTPLEMLKERFRHMGLKNIQTVRANLEIPGSSTLADNSQDIVLLANVLFQSPKKNEIIREAKRILKPGSRLVLVEWRKGAGGFGPPDDLRMDEDAIHSLVLGEGFQASGDLHIGKFHHIMQFTK